MLRVAWFLRVSGLYICAVPGWGEGKYHEACRSGPAEGEVA